METDNPSHLQTPAIPSTSQAADGPSTRVPAVTCDQSNKRRKRDSKPNSVVTEASITPSALANNPTRFGEWFVGTYMLDAITELQDAVDRLARCQVPQELERRDSPHYRYVTSKLRGAQTLLMSETAGMRQPSTMTTMATSEPSIPTAAAAPEPSTATTTAVSEPSAAVMAPPTDDELADILPVILMMAADLQRMKNDPDPSTGKFGEMNWRAPIDTLMRQMFMHDPQSSTYRYEVSIHMPRSDTEMRVGNKPTMDAGWFLIRRRYYNKLQGLASRVRMSILGNTTILTAFQRSDLSTLQFASQGQLRALGVKDRIVYGLACTEEKAKVMWSKWEDETLYIGLVTEFDLTKPSDGVRLYLFLQQIRADGPDIISQLDSMTREQLVESSGSWSWKAQWIDSDAMPPPANPTQLSQPGPAGNQHHLRYNDQIIDDCEADNSDGYEDEPLSEEELEDPMEQVQLWVSFVASHGSQESDPSLVRPHDSKIDGETRAKLIDGQMPVVAPAVDPLS
ncbi:hypothetical protein FRB93_011027 [Tulasnella sp. JGI-2019a]|nr:hypothetical protein FRB93_011027 [Tulasnella sp. JGI-2019a]